MSDATGIAVTPTAKASEGYDDLVKKVSDKMAGLAVEDEPTPVEEEVVETPEIEDGDTEVIEESPSDDVEASDGEAADEESSPTLPDAHRRALKAYEWTDDDIDRAMEADAANFLAMATKIHASRVQETQRWAALGRQSKEPTTAPTETAPAAQPAAAPSNPGALDFEKMAEESGFDKAVLEQAFGPLVQTVDAMNQLLPSINEGIEAVRQQEQQRLASDIDRFFQQDTMTSFKDFYGESWDTASDEQTKHRTDLLVMADNIKVGAAQHGQDLSVDDAMELAHHTVAKDVTERVVRDKIKTQVTKRAEGLSLKPTSKTADTPEGEKSRDTLISDTRNRLAKIFG